MYVLKQDEGDAQDKKTGKKTTKQTKTKQNKTKQSIKKIIKTPNRTAENQTLLYTYM